MGVVYRARDPRIGRIVAIKLLRIDSQELRDRFEREARSAGNLTQANIVTIFDFGEHDGRPFIVMEYVQGETLAYQIRNRAPLTLATKLDLMDMLASGLGYAHSQGVIHRDIKPANLMIDRHGVLKILDFGIARMDESSATQAGMMVGTPNYMSPEQVEGRTLDLRSDIFAVGAVFYELLSYRVAFAGESIHGTLDRVLRSEPEPLAVVCPGLDPAVQFVVAKALEKNPADRYQTLGQLRLELTRCRAHLSSADASDAHQTLAGSIAQSPAARTPRSGTSREKLSRKRADQIEAHLKAATEAFDSGDYDAAIAACEEAAILDPDNSRALLCMDRAREALDRQQVAELASQAEALVERGDWKTARDVIGHLLQIDPQSAEVARLNQRVAEAEEREQRARQRQQRIDALLKTARQHLSDQAWDEAFRASSDALELDRQNLEAQEMSRLAVVAIQERQARETRERREQERREREAAEAKRVRQAQERWLTERLAAAQTAIDARRFDHAIETLEQVLRVKPDATTAVAMLEAARQSHVERTVVLQREARRSDPPAPAIEQPLATVAGAVEHEQTSHQRPFIYLAAAAMGIVLAISGWMFSRTGSPPPFSPAQFEPSVTVAPPKASSPAPVPPPASSPVPNPSSPATSPPRQAPESTGTSPRRQGDQPRADVESLIASGYDRFAQGAYDQALAFFRNALALDPGNRRAQDGLNRVANAKSIEERVLQNPGSATQVAAELAKADDAFGLGQYERAIEAFQTVLRLDSSNASAQAGLLKAQRAKAAEDLILRKK